MFYGTPTYRGYLTHYYTLCEYSAVEGTITNRICGPGWPQRPSHPEGRPNRADAPQDYGYQILDPWSRGPDPGVDTPDQGTRVQISGWCFRELREMFREILKDPRSNHRNCRNGYLIPTTRARGSIEKTYTEGEMSLPSCARESVNGAKIGCFSINPVQMPHLGFLSKYVQIHP